MHITLNDGFNAAEPQLKQEWILARDLNAHFLYLYAKYDEVCWSLKFITPSSIYFIMLVHNIFSVIFQCQAELKELQLLAPVHPRLYLLWSSLATEV